MSPLLILRLFINETFKPQVFKRVAEPDLVMTDIESVKSYSNILSSPESSMSVYYQFVLEALSNIIETTSMGSSLTIGDFGCGTGEVLIPLAQAFREHQFLGFDLSSTMMNVSQQKALDLGLSNIQWVQDDFSELRSVQDHTLDIAYSSMALHHCMDLAQFQRTLLCMKRVLKPGGHFFLGDLGRFTCKNNIPLMKASQSYYEPKLLEDYENSLMAAFSKSEWIEALKLLNINNTDFYYTSAAPLLLFASNHPLNTNCQNHLIKQRRRRFLFKKKIEYLLLKLFLKRCQALFTDATRP